jgi:MoxR-like ATPase
MDKRRAAFVETLRTALANREIDPIITHTDLTAFAQEAGWSVVPLWFRADDNPLKIGRGKYDLSSLATGATAGPAKVAKTAVAAPAAKTAPAPSASENSPVLTQSLVSQESTVPQRDPDFIEWGHYDDCKTIIASEKFYPVFVTGLSGNGKTTMIQQACAAAKRECYRINITAQTDEDDLLGGFRLINGETVWFDGPVIQAMKAGAILLLDEVDLGTAPLMCLQPVLEGRGIFLKKINQFVSPAAGFQVFATANTKGKGDDTGSFAHTGILNEAFLDRFPVTMDQPYPATTTEKKIVFKKMKTLACEDKGFCENLVKWAGAIRDTFLAGGASEIITTRRLLSIVQAFAIFGDKRKAIEMAISRFDGETKADFLKLYEKIDADVAARSAGPENAANSATSGNTVTVTNNACPF